MNLDGYVTVDERLRLALDTFPELRIVEQAPEIVTVGDQAFVSVTTTVYRNPDDPIPTTGTAWEPFPGRTPFTKDSEMMNAATSALGRALGYMGLGLSKSIATRDEVETAQRRRPDTEDRPRGPQIARSGPNPSTPGQGALIQKMCAERGIERDTPELFEDASKLIEELKKLPKVQ